MNNFYASVEILYDPTLRDKPVAVAGDEEARHGIVLAKNDIAKRFGIRTGQVLWEARQQCPGLVCVPAHYERYLAFSAQARDIYTSYTDQVEPFGLDECWLDVTGSVGLFGDGPAIADDIRGRIRRELGLTVSVGVSFNKGINVTKEIIPPVTTTFPTVSTAVRSKVNHGVLGIRIMVDAVALIDRLLDFRGKQACPHFLKI